MSKSISFCPDSIPIRSLYMSYGPIPLRPEKSWFHSVPSHKSVMTCHVTHVPSSSVLVHHIPFHIVPVPSYPIPLVLDPVLFRCSVSCSHPYPIPWYLGPILTCLVVSPSHPYPVPPSRPLITAGPSEKVTKWGRRQQGEGGARGEQGDGERGRGGEGDGEGAWSK